MSKPLISGLLTPDEAARVIGVKASTLACWRCTGRNDLPFLKIGGRVLYRPDDLRDWLNSRVKTCTREVTRG